MSAQAVLARVWAPATLAVVSSVVVGFSINFITSDAADWWWWLILALGVVGGIGAGVLSALGLKRVRSSAAAPLAQVNPVAVQAASNQGTNISINADRGSAAAYQMGEVHIGQTRNREERKES